MRTLRALWKRLRGMFGSAQADNEFTAELDSHVAMHIEDNLRSGMTPEEARRKALLQLGGVEQTKQAYRERGTLPLAENLLQDLRFAVRQLRKNPGFTATAVLMLALGMGACVAIFAFVDAALIRPLPYVHPNRLVAVYETTRMCPRCNVSCLNFRDWKKSSLPFNSLDVWGYSRFLLRGSEGTEPAQGTRVSDGFFRTLGVTPILGRDFYVGEDSPGAPRTVLISYGAWKKRFGGKQDVVGQQIMLSDVSYTIIGVLPQGFHFGPRGESEFWTALNDPNSCELRRGCHNLFGLARLRDGSAIKASLKNAAASMTAIESRLVEDYPDANRGFGVLVMPLSETIVGDIRPILLVLLCGAGLLLMIACVNVVSLLLVRTESRRQEIAVRGALGASRERLGRQFVTEGLILVVTGAALGLGSAYGVMQLLLKLIPSNRLEAMPFLEGLGMNAHVMAFGGMIALLAAVLFTIAPVVRLISTDMRGDLAEGGRNSAGKGWRRLGSRLVIVELALAVVMLAGAGLLGKSLYMLLHVNLGMQPDHLATLLVAMPHPYATETQVMALERQIESRVESLPGVKSASISSGMPAKSWDGGTYIVVPGRPESGERNDVPERAVSAEYFTTLGARLMRGRYFTGAEDDASKPNVAVINQTLAKQFFPGENPVGKQLAYQQSKQTMQIIGVVEDIKEGQLDTSNRGVLYVPFNQNYSSAFSLIVRSSKEEAALLPTLVSAVHTIDPGIATSDAMTMNDSISDSRSVYLHRSSAWLIGGFAMLALVLAVIGLYGVVAYSVSQRTREIGVRIALGAQRSSIYQLILKEAGRLIVFGVAAGLVGAIAAGMLMRKLLFGTRAWDIPTLAAVAVVLAVAALAASYIPARCAASVNPVEALRAE